MSLRYVLPIFKKKNKKFDEGEWEGKWWMVLDDIALTEYR